MVEHLRKYKDRPAQTYVENIGWIKDSVLATSPDIKKEIERINARRIRNKLEPINYEKEAGKFSKSKFWLHRDKHWGLR